MEEETKEEEKLDLNSLQQHVLDYLKTRLKSIQLTVIEYIAEIMPVFIFVAILSVLILVFWIFVNVSAALAIGSYLEDNTIGFAIISGFNLLLAIIFIFTYKAIIFKIVSNWIVRTLTKSLEQNEKN